jgi:putative restriction endonuclease
VSSIPTISRLASSSTANASIWCESVSRHLQASADGRSALDQDLFPRRGGRVWYEDQREAHRQIYAGDDVVEYAFMGTDQNSPDNRWLRQAMENQTPVVYFLGVSPGRYQPIVPTFIVGWFPDRLRVQLAFGTIVGASAQATVAAPPERRYALREIRARLHQASFRDVVLAAYGRRCAISRLPEPRLVESPANVKTLR